MKRKTSRKIKGIGASGGIAIGGVYVIDKEDVRIFERPLSQEEVPHQILKFEDKLTQKSREIYIKSKRKPQK